MKGRGCDTVLPAQGDLSAQKAVTDKYGAWWNDDFQGKAEETGREICSSVSSSPGFEPVVPAMRRQHLRI
jgi:hypothetical protein